jgi:polysaccharide pyruvyl transferase WcaK-like protein
MPTALAMDLAFRAPSLRSVAVATSRDTPRAIRSIGWAPRPYRPDHRQWGRPDLAEATTLTAVRSILAGSDDRLRLFAHVRASGQDDDRRAVDRIVEAVSPAERARIDIDPDPKTLTDAVRRYSAVDVLITSRMHAAIFAMAAGTPAVAVGYEPKVAGVMNVIGLGDRVIPADERLTADDVVSLVAGLRSDVERARTRDAFRSAGERLGDFQASLA